MKMNYQFMHGARVCNGKFDRYKQSIKPVGSGCIPGKEPPNATDLDYLANDVANTVYKSLKLHLSFWTYEWENMVPMELGTTFARLGCSPFTTMGSTLNFYVNGHYDDADSGFGVISWFERFFNPTKCTMS